MSLYRGIKGTDTNELEVGRQEVLCVGEDEECQLKKVMQPHQVEERQESIEILQREDKI